MDIAVIKNLLNNVASDREKQRLCEITRMLIGLRKTWDTWRLQDDQPSPKPENWRFHHEDLQVYGAALDLARWLGSLPVTRKSARRYYRTLDQSITSIALNIAEGNGRYAQLDHRKFLDLAACSAVKAAAFLDLAVETSSLLVSQTAPATALLERIAAMLSHM